ncbi:glucose-6-phosphate phosphate-translocator precursor [Nannochloropsis oceanica]
MRLLVLGLVSLGVTGFAHTHPRLLKTPGAGIKARTCFAEPPSASSTTSRALALCPRNAASLPTAAPVEAAVIYNLQPTPIVSPRFLISTRGGASTAAKPATSTLKVGSFFFLWYLFNIGYNIYNKKALNVLPLPWTVGLIQLSLGLLYVFPLWALGIRKAPKLTVQNVKNLLPVALMHAMAHISAVISLGAGAVSFTHIIKAAEPAFTSLFSALFLKQFFAPVVYASLIPVMGGVAIASLTERKFSWLAFNSAMLANTASAGRGIFAKKTMKEPQGQNMDAANLYAVLTILATLIMAPAAVLVEGSKVRGAWQAALAVTSQKQLINYIISSGLYFYLYNEVAFLALDSVHPVTHAVGNTIKRVVIIGASILVFKNPVTMQGYIGSAVAIAGVLLYSLAVEKTKKRA